MNNYNECLELVLKRDRMSFEYFFGNFIKTGYYKDIVKEIKENHQDKLIDLDTFLSNPQQYNLFYLRENEINKDNVKDVLTYIKKTRNAHSKISFFINHKILTNDTIKMLIDLDEINILSLSKENIDDEIFNIICKMWVEDAVSEFIIDFYKSMNNEFKDRNTTSIISCIFKNTRNLKGDIKSHVMRVIPLKYKLKSDIISDLVNDENMCLDEKYIKLDLLLNVDKVKQQKVFKI